jgi:hypothetical protein
MMPNFANRVDNPSCDVSIIGTLSNCVQIVHKVFSKSSDGA